MPIAPARPCAVSDCPNLTTNKIRYCDEHLKQTTKERQSSSQRGYDYHWQQSRSMYLREHPLCVWCHMQGFVVPATTVDHIVPHKGDYNLMWDTNNWQALCTRHHNIKTASMDGGLGNEETRG